VKVIFCDIDGVLNNGDDPWLEVAGLRPECVTLLNTVAAAVALPAAK
jgi:hypothetical protein